jgi:Raf kinase inhibitor-like YbhB/YbcL family protein
MDERVLRRPHKQSIRALIACFSALAILFGAACGGDNAAEATATVGAGLVASPPAQITVTSPDFRDGGDIPAQFTCDGEDISPQIEWSELPAGTQAVALITDDPDAPRGIFTHWVIYNLPPDLRSVPRDIADGDRLASGAMQGENDFGDTGYGGPCPPQGSAHEYRFLVFALSAPVALEPGASAEELLEAMQGLVVAQGQLTGMYARR